MGEDVSEQLSALTSVISTLVSRIDALEARTSAADVPAAPSAISSATTEIDCWPIKDISGSISAETASSAAVRAYFPAGARAEIVFPGAEAHGLPNAIPPVTEPFWDAQPGRDEWNDAGDPGFAAVGLPAAQLELIADTAFPGIVDVILDEQALMVASHEPHEVRTPRFVLPSDEKEEGFEAYDEEDEYDMPSTATTVRSVRARAPTPLPARAAAAAAAAAVAAAAAGLSESDYSASECPTSGFCDASNGDHRNSSAGSCSCSCSSESAETQREHGMASTSAPAVVSQPGSASPAPAPTSGDEITADDVDDEPTVVLSSSPSAASSSDLDEDGAADSQPVLGDLLSADALQDLAYAEVDADTDDDATDDEGITDADASEEVAEPEEACLVAGDATASAGTETPTLRLSAPVSASGSGPSSTAGSTPAAGARRHARFVDVEDEHIAPAMICFEECSSASRSEDRSESTRTAALAPALVSSPRHTPIAAAAAAAATAAQCAPSASDDRPGPCPGLPRLGGPGAAAAERTYGSHFAALSRWRAARSELAAVPLRVLGCPIRTGFTAEPSRSDSGEAGASPGDVLGGRYAVIAHLGTAAFSSAYQCLDRLTGTHVCVKVVNDGKDTFDQSLDEIQLLAYANARDPTGEAGCVRMIDHFYWRERLHIVFELLKESLYDVQVHADRQGRPSFYTVPRVRSIARQLLRALDFLHGIGLIHSDVKPENVLMASYARCEVRLIDLGCSCFVFDHLSDYVQSRSYRAPEVLLGLPYNELIDIWSLGCVLFELLTGQVLFVNDAVPTILARMVAVAGPFPRDLLLSGSHSHEYFTRDGHIFEYGEDGVWRLFVPKRTSLAARSPAIASEPLLGDFLAQMLTIDPRRRPSARELLKHPFLAE